MVRKREEKKKIETNKKEKKRKEKSRATFRGVFGRFWGVKQFGQDFLAKNFQIGTDEGISLFSLEGEEVIRVHK